jgi:hypothetical protein
MQSSFSSEKCDFRLDSRFADAAFSMQSDKCDFRFAMTIGNRSIVITGDRTSRLDLDAQLGGLHIGAGSDKCDWKITSLDDRVQSSVYSSTKGWAVKGQTRQMTAEIGQSRRAGSAKCDFLNLKTRNLNVVIASEKCDNRGLIDQDWIMRSGARNRIIDVASAKCDWSVSSIPRNDPKRG